MGPFQHAAGADAPGEFRLPGSVLRRTGDHPLGAGRLPFRQERRDAGQVSQSGDRDQSAGRRAVHRQKGPCRTAGIRRRSVDTTRVVKFFFYVQNYIPSNPSIPITDPKTRIIATGGASTNDTILQILSDVFNAPVYRQVSRLFCYQLIMEGWSIFSVEKLLLHDFHYYYVSQCA